MSIIVLGAGGHGKVVADILKMRGDLVVGYLDDDPTLLEKEPLGLPVLGHIADYIRYPDTNLILGIGSNRIRFHITQQVAEREAVTRWTTAIHPHAYVASSAQVGAGTVIAAGAVVNPDTVLGTHVIINTSSSIDHDCVIEDFVHIAPGAHLGGGVHIGQGTLVGIGAIVLPYRTIGQGAIIGAGSVITKDIPPNTTAVGIPSYIVATRLTDWRLSR